MSKNRRIIFGVCGAGVLIVSHRIDRNADSNRNKKQLEMEIAAHNENVENFGRFFRFGMVSRALRRMRVWHFSSHNASHAGRYEHFAHVSCGWCVF